MFNEKGGKSTRFLHSGQETLTRDADVASDNETQAQQKRALKKIRDVRSQTFAEGSPTGFKFVLESLCLWRRVSERPA